MKSAIVQVDAALFKQWYLQHYGVDIGRKKKTAASAKKIRRGNKYLIFFYSILFLMCG